MARFKHLLIFSICVGFSYVVPSVSSNAMRKNNEVIIGDDNSVKLNHTLDYENGILSLFDTECYCGENSILCGFDDKKEKICLCKHGFSPKSSKNSLDAVCTECDCGTKSKLCDFYSDTKRCYCGDGSIAIDKMCPDCDCGENSISCKYDDEEEKICTCKPGFAPKISKYTSDVVCTECNCGSTAVSCAFEFGVKACTCPDGNVILGDVMCPYSECDCGDNSISCEINVFSRKKCICKEGFYPAEKLLNFDEECKKCDCGTGATSCKFNNVGQRICTCKEGYAVYKNFDKSYTEVQECKKCDCGVDGISCSFGSSKFRQCTCRYDSYSEYDYSSGGDTCKRCNCGIFSISCRKEYGVKKCTCMEGYYARRPFFGSDEECTINDGRSTFPSGWKIATYIVGFIYVGLFILLIVIMRQKRRNSTP